MKRLLGRLLHLANSSPPIERKAFYAMKTHILERWGTPDGHDVQHIPGKQCFGCDGTGIYDERDEYQDYCWRCGGSGWWKSPCWIVLQRYTLGGYPFHIPRERSYKAPEPNVTNIVGYVEHRHYGHETTAAALWLALAFDRRLFWSMLTGRRPCGIKYWRRHPILWINVAASKLSGKWRDWKRRCNRCGRHTWGSTTFICKRCSYTGGEDLLPF